jgi:hypothetical protein
MKKCIQFCGFAVAPLRDTAIGLGILLAFFACSPKTTSPVIGNWLGEEGKVAMEFRVDGTLHGVDEYGRAWTGSFEFVDADHVRIKTTTSEGKGATRFVDNSEGTCKIDVQGNSLTLTEPDGALSKYRKDQVKR